MADISQIQISNTVYNIKDNPARTEISEMPHSTSGTIGGWAIYDGYIEPNDYLDRDLRFYSSNSTENDCHIDGYVFDDDSNEYISVLQIYPEYIHTPSLTVDEVTTFNGNVVNNAQLTVYGETYLLSPLSVQGSANLSDTLTVDGVATFNDNVNISSEGILSVEGSARVGGTLSVTGNTALSGTLDITGNITTDGNIYLANNKSLYGTDTSGTNYILASLNSSDQVLFGTTSNVTYLRGSTIYLQGATSLNSTLTVSGTATFSKTTDASGTANNSPALIVGGSATSAHLELDANEIVAKASGTTTAPLYINTDGGNVYVHNFYVPEVERGSGTITVSSSAVYGSVAITYTQSFSGTPTPICIPNSGMSSNICMGVTSVSQTGFTANLYRGSSGSTNFYWIAVYEYHSS